MRAKHAAQLGEQSTAKILFIYFEEIKTALDCQWESSPQDSAPSLAH